MNEELLSQEGSLRRGMLLAGLVAIGLIALGCVGYSRRLVPASLTIPEARAGEVGSLVVIGPAKVTIEHDDRSRPCAHVFRVLNPSARPVAIRQVSTSCSCTVVSPIEGILGAGCERLLKLEVNRFDPYETSFSTTATIESDTGILEVKLAGTVPPTRKVLYRPQVLYLKPERLAWPAEHLVTLRLLKTCAGKADERSVRVIGGPARIDRISERDDGPHYTELTIAVTLPALDPNAPPWGRIEIDAGCEAVAIPVVILGAATGGS
jgi:hypothetical protein